MKTILIFATSINGFIADTSDETNWSNAEWQAYEADIHRVGNLIMGRRTYDIMSHGGYLDSLGMRNIIILSHTNIDSSYKVVKSPSEALKHLESLGETEVVIAGGANIATQFIEEGLLNEVILDIEPSVINSGIPMFGNIKNIPVLKLINTKILGEDIVRIYYQIIQ